MNALDYCGQICVVLHNHSESDYVIKSGQRIAQLIVTKIEECILIHDISLLERKTARQNSGFGSTGQ
jgi:dUTP pyrophosphatase